MREAQSSGRRVRNTQSFRMFSRAGLRVRLRPTQKGLRLRARQKAHEVAKSYSVNRLRWKLSVLLLAEKTNLRRNSSPYFRVVTRHAGEHRGGLRVGPGMPGRRAGARTGGRDHRTVAAGWSEAADKSDLTGTAARRRARPGSESVTVPRQSLAVSRLSPA
jgi:hypothetical protein